MYKPPYTALNDEQRRTLSDAVALHEAQQSLRSEAAHYRGGMAWKTVGEKDYLYRLESASKQVSLGPRSPETESLHERFHRGKAEVRAQMKTLDERVSLQSKYLVANRLGRLPTIAGGVIRCMIDGGYAFRVVGTNALYAYETMAGVQFMRDTTATLDVDLLFDGRRRLRLAGERDATPQQLLSTIQQADATFRRVQGFRAVNASGYMVDVITPTRDWQKANPHTRTATDDLQLVEIPHLEWLANAPAIPATVFTVSGKAISFDTIDPRFYAVFKVFLASEPSREPIKKQRDLSQALAVAALVNEHLPWLSFADPALQVFPASLRQQALALFNENTAEPLRDSAPRAR